MQGSRRALWRSAPSRAFVNLVSVAGGSRLPLALEGGLVQRVNKRLAWRDAYGGRPPKGALGHALGNHRSMARSRQPIGHGNLMSASGLPEKTGLRAKQTGFPVSRRVRRHWHGNLRGRGKRVGIDFFPCDRESGFVTGQGGSILGGCVVFASRKSLPEHDFCVSCPDESARLRARRGD